MGRLSVFVLLVSLYRISALKIVEPHPDNQVLIEGESTKISCSYVDASEYPTITFQRRPDGDLFFKDIKTNERVYVTNSTRNTTEGWLTTAILHITSVKTEDDSEMARGAWQCHASMPAGKSTEQRFTVNVISKADLPRASIVGGGAVPYGEKVTLTCKVTDGKASLAPLEGLWWIKDGKILKNGTKNTIEPLVITSVSSRDGGEYHCVGAVLLKNHRRIQMVLDKTVLNTNLKIDGNTTKLMANESGNVTMECPADGYPLNVTWMRVNKEGQETSLDSQRYVVTRPCSSCRFRLTISNIQSRDQGRYVCKASGLGSGKHYFDLWLSQEPPEASAVTYGVQTFVILLAGLVALLVV